MSTVELSWKLKSSGKSLIQKAVKTIPIYARRRLFWILARALDIKAITVNGPNGTIQGSPFDEVVFRDFFYNGCFSDDLIALIVERHEKNRYQSFIDIGANIGLFTVNIAAKTGAKVFAFEPEPLNYRFLSNNVAHSSVAHLCTLYNMALFTETSEVDFELSPNNHGDHRIRVGNAKGSFALNEHLRTVTRVKADRLDKIVSLDQTGTPFAAKIDTQGSEYHIYSGGRSLLSKADMLIVEYWPYAINRMKGDPTALMEMVLADFPYAALWRPGKPFHNPDLSMPSGRLKDALCGLVAANGVDDWADLILVKSP